MHFVQERMFNQLLMVTKAALIMDYTGRNISRSCIAAHETYLISCIFMKHGVQYFAICTQYNRRKTVLLQLL